MIHESLGRFDPTAFSFAVSRGIQIYRPLRSRAQRARRIKLFILLRGLCGLCGKNSIPRRGNL